MRSTDINKKCWIFIGNGFDLHLNLNSSFDSFFRKIVLKNNKFDDENSNLLYLLIFLRFYNTHQPQADFFRKVTLTNVNWMDIESFIKKIAREEEMISNLYSCYQQACTLRRNPKTAFLHETPKRIKIIHCLARRELPTDEGISILNKLLFDDLQEFKDDFKNHLLNENKNISFNSRPQFLERIIDTVYQNKSFPLLRYVTNFNYTTISRNVDEYNIHGTLDSNIVLGYDSSSAPIEKHEMFELSKEWQKLSIEPVFLIGDDFVESLIFYGHSLGEQDYPYFFTVFDHCKLDNPNSKTTLYFCYSIFSESKAWKSFDKYRMNIVKMLNEYERSVNPNCSRNKLFASLFASGRIRLIEIKD